MTTTGENETTVADRYKALAVAAVKARAAFGQLAEQVKAFHLIASELAGQVEQTFELENRDNDGRLRP